MWSKYYKNKGNIVFFDYNKYFENIELEILFMQI